MTLSRAITLPAVTEEEGLMSFTVNVGHSVVVTIGYGTTSVNGFVRDITRNTKSVQITGDYFRALMDDHPAWSPLKPAGTFRTEDLWLVLDAMEAGTVLIEPEVLGTSPQNSV